MDGARTGARAPDLMTRPAAVASAGPLLRPFAGLRFDEHVAGPLHSLMAPPHTELDRTARAAFLSSSPYVVTHLERPEYSAGPGPAVRRWLAERALVQDAPGLYVVRQQRAGHTQHFLMAELQVRAEDQRVRAHEGVFDQAVVARVQRLQNTEVDSEPVLLVDSSPWPVPWTRPERLGEHLVHATDTGGAPMVDVWHITDPDIVALIGEASAAHRFVIADGHHRHAAVERMARVSGLTERLLVAVVDQTVEPVDLRALHRILPTSAADHVVREAVRRREVPRDLDAAARIARGLGRDQALVLTPQSFVVVERPPATQSVVGSGAWVDGVVQTSGVSADRVKYVAEWNDIIRAFPNQSAVLLPRITMPGLEAVVDRGFSLGRKVTSFRPKPLAGAVLRLR